MYQSDCKLVKAVWKTYSKSFYASILFCPLKQPITLCI